MFAVTGNSENDTCTISVSGRIDSTNANEFSQQIDEFDACKRIVLDLEGLEYTSSAGLRVILRLRKKHPDIEIKNCSSEVYEIFDMTGFTEMMPVSRAYRRISVEGCEVIGRGANGEVYRIDPDTVVKVYLNDDALPDIEHEREVARKALVLGIPTAISYDVVKVGDHYASMFEMINAKSFSELLADDSNNLEHCAQMYVNLLKLIHSTEVPAGELPNQKDITIGWIEYIKDYLPGDVYKKLYSLIEAIPYDNHMIHGDYHTKNIMLQNDEVMLIDMDTLAVGHPVLELASIYNAYVGYHLVDHNGVKDFLGIDYDVSVRLWKRILELYYDTQDESLLKQYEDKAKVVGLIRVMRRTIRRDKNLKLIEACKQELCALSKRVDSLI